MIITCLTLFIGMRVQGQNAQIKACNAKAAVVVRKADSLTLLKLRSNKDYNYDVVKPDRLLTWWEKVKQWFWDKLIAFFDDKGALHTSGFH